ncbi:MAG: hypothetical protein WAO76_09470 [Georgfuchsia sp.]
MIDAGQFVDLGAKPGMTKSFVMFYSIPDDAYFVTIRDVLTGTFITVLPEEYHENLSWPISENQRVLAKKLAGLRSEPVTKPAARIASLSANYLLPSGDIMTKGLGKLDADGFETDLEGLRRNKLDRYEIKRLVEAKGIDYSSVQYFILRIGSQIQPYCFDPP